MPSGFTGRRSDVSLGTRRLEDVSNKQNCLVTGFDEHWPVYQVQVKIAGLEVFQGLGQARSDIRLMRVPSNTVRLLILMTEWDFDRVISHSHFARDKDFLARNARFLNGLSYFAF